MLDQILLFVIVSATSPNLTYDKNIKSIFEKRCAACHNVNWPDKNWLVYENAFRDRVKIKNRVWEVRNMPIGPIDEEERRKIKDWIDQGAKR